MLAMSRALASDPALLLLDELSMGLAPLIVDELYETVAADRRERRLDPVHRAVRPDRAAGLRLRGGDDRRPDRGHRRARRDPRHHVRRHPRRSSMIRASCLARRGRCRSAGSPPSPVPRSSASAAAGRAGVQRLQRLRLGGAGARSRSTSRRSRSRPTRSSRSSSAYTRVEADSGSSVAGAPAGCGRATRSARA